jgi:hypothetical protein
MSILILLRFLTFEKSLKVVYLYIIFTCYMKKHLIKVTYPTLVKIFAVEVLAVEIQIK